MKMCSASSYFCHKRIENSLFVHNKMTHDASEHKLINRGWNICSNFNDMLNHLKTEWLLSTEITSGLLQPARRSASFTVSEHFAPVVYFIPRSNKVLEIVSIPNFCRENNFKRWMT